MPTNSALANPTHSARDRLLDAALELFATRGFQAIGLRDLASYLGLHAGSLYHHIENKQSLLFELIESALSDLLLDTLRRIKGARSPGKRLQLFIQAFIAFHFNEKYKLVLITREFANLNEEQQQQVIQLKNRYCSVLTEIITDEYAKEGNTGAQICATTSAVIVMLFGQSHWYSVETTEAQLTEALTNVVTCIIANSNKVSAQGLEVSVKPGLHQN
ncbi:transcriptional regulator [Pseudomonas sp. Leaf48]|jgi:AcrR family transcriptional regulator|uniref:TetR/AcrR family transcriptional regulator n=1 Tax=unclassified Pseudomonas TaxID=196821 RepID=UPI000724CF11|nr:MULTISPECIES: TetR/AcrR family transcriptional regulator [unclassified Pseudomonas]KQN42559.1 transcriptional regulator [Pseudomonas sp. Leaf48]MBV7479461.1 TetR/AcrR family transcriptional regulator [Pseudomonas sp. PDM31]